MIAHYTLRDREANRCEAIFNTNHLLATDKVWKYIYLQFVDKVYIFIISPVVEKSSTVFRDLPPAHLVNVGRSDLDPFAPGGGGMLFNPFGPGNRNPDEPGVGIPGGLPRYSNLIST